MNANLLPFNVPFGDWEKIPGSMGTSVPDLVILVIFIVLPVES